VDKSNCGKCQYRGECDSECILIKMIKEEEKSLSSREITFGDNLDKLTFRTPWPDSEPELPKVKWTPLELKLVRYLKMGLGSVEIAKLLDMTPGAVYKKVHDINQKGKKLNRK